MLLGFFLLWIVYCMSWYNPPPPLLENIKTIEIYDAFIIIIIIIIMVVVIIIVIIIINIYWANTQ